MPTPPIYLPSGGTIMPPMAPGGEPSHPIVIPPGSWVHVDNTLPDSGNKPMNPIDPGGQPTPH
jgi:hypothetical protein